MFLSLVLKGSKKFSRKRLTTAFFVYIIKMNKGETGMAVSLSLTIK